MAFDGIVLNSVVNELKNKLIGARIDKVYQPEKDELFIQTHSKGQNYKLLLSASSNNPRLYLSENSKKNPMEPPMFCMILRKHLIGANILNIGQYKTDRIAYIDLISKDELGINREKRLVIEIMGRHSNIILLDKESGKIIDSINRVSEDMSSVRQVFPGASYQLPPLQDKENPLDLEKSSFMELLEAFDSKNPVFKFIYMSYLGLSPVISRQICFNAGLDSKTKISNLTKKEVENLYSEFYRTMARLESNDFQPNIAYDEDGKILDFHILELSQFKDSQIKHFDSISQLLDNYFYEKDLMDRIGQKSQSLRKIVKNNLDRAKKKLKKQNYELEDARDREKYKVYADIISANIYRIERGASQVELENFYDPEMKTIDIPLNKKVSAPMNAQNYYKKYSRLKNASKLLSEQIPQTRDEITYLENVVYSIDNALELEDLDEIREELVSENYIKKARKKKKAQSRESQPHKYITSGGIDVLVGKNNRQNDELTFKKSSREDLWLHIQNMPGSHVILKSNGQDYSQADLEEAALLSAYYSSAKNSKNIPIDYTERKHVRKPKAAKAGLVFYENFNTIIVTPSRDLIAAIEKVE